CRVEVRPSFQREGWPATGYRDGEIRRRVAELHYRPRCYRSLRRGTGCRRGDAFRRRSTQRRNLLISQRALANLQRVNVTFAALVIVPVAHHEEFWRQGKPRIHRIAVANDVLAVFEAIDELGHLARGARQIHREDHPRPLAAYVIVARLLDDVVVERAAALPVGAVAGPPEHVPIGRIGKVMGLQDRAEPGTLGAPEHIYDQGILVQFVGQTPAIGPQAMIDPQTQPLEDRSSGVRLGGLIEWDVDDPGV